MKIARPREGLGGRSPPKNNTIFILALCAPRIGPDVSIGETGFPHPLPGGRVWEGVEAPRRRASTPSQEKLFSFLWGAAQRLTDLPA